MTVSAVPAGGGLLSPPLRDAQGRLMTYLRLSVTDRCNFRCTYCSPASWGGKKDLLEAWEFERIVSVFARMGIERVRLTGGEPLIRPDILEISSRIGALPGIRQVAITTNATRLEALAKGLRGAGVGQLNVSLDTLSEETFRKISPQGELPPVLRGIDAAVAQGFPVLKLNVVVMKGLNEDEVPSLIRFAHERGMVPRFIELMPFGKGEPVPTATLVERLRASGMPLREDGLAQGRAAGPARYWDSPTGKVGFISPMTQNFCGGCNRVRVASNGDLRSCLGGRAQSPLHALLRGGASDEVLARSIREALGDKQDGHRFNEPEAGSALLSMMGIGG